jgi:hypothetical protein
MSIKEKFQKELDIIEGKIRFFRNGILGIITGLVWSVYAILEKKADEKIFILSGVGVVILILLFLKSKSLEKEQYEILEELEKEN